jgi:ribosomal silencing factor RsfS
MADAHARDVIIVDVSQRCDFADSMVIATGVPRASMLSVAAWCHMHCQERNMCHWNLQHASAVVTGNSSGHVRAVAQAVHSKVRCVGLHGCNAKGL